MADLRTQIAATLFRAAPGGYVYRESYRWPFGRAPHYLVNADQKDALLAVIVPERPMLWHVFLLSMLCLMAASSSFGLWLYTGHDTPTAIDGLTIVVLTVGQVVLALALLFWWKRRKLRPLLATLTPTDLRITQSEMRTAATNTMSGKQLLIAGLAGVFASIALLVNAALQLAWGGRPMGLLCFAGSLMFAGFAWYYLRQLVNRAEKP